MDSSAMFTNNVSLKYSIDGLPRGDVIADSVPAANRTTYVYNKTLLDVTGLTDAQHTLRVDVRKPSLLLVRATLLDDKFSPEPLTWFG